MLNFNFVLYIFILYFIKSHSYSVLYRSVAEVSPIHNLKYLFINCQIIIFSSYLKKIKSVKTKVILQFISHQTK